MLPLDIPIQPPLLSIHHDRLVSFQHFGHGWLRTLYVLLRFQIKKMFDKVIVKVSLQCCCGDILTVQPCHRYCCDRVVM